MEAIPFALPMGAELPIRRRTCRRFLAAIVLLIGPLIGARPCEAVSSIFFRPSGTQVDADAIPDILTSPGAEITFRVSLDLQGASANLTGISYVVHFDPNELNFFEGNLDPDGLFATDNSSLDPGATLTVTHLTGAVAGGGTVLLDELKFIVQPGLTNDGVADFEFSGVTGAGANVGAIEFPQTGVKAVEVQPVPEPETPLLLAAALVGLTIATTRRGGFKPG